ncbi:unnamed protein product [Mytilus coruscus]|uniref:C-type lectin domain-containing protein n=1 Tax=Mytilus coruscus TaxID=42192 RepID=A0A6J8BMX0_MYTCO|nr:unnamed protein product [Mytilus coruscus]
MNAFLDIPGIPQLCIIIKRQDNYNMHDQYCYEKDGLICQKEINLTSNDVCESGWKNIRNRCYKRLRHKHSGVDFSDARKLCSNENAYIMMPQSQSEAKEIANGLDSERLDCKRINMACFDSRVSLTGVTVRGYHRTCFDFNVCLIGGTVLGYHRALFDSDLCLTDGEPNKRNMDYVCEYIQNGKLNNGDCKATERVICVIDAIDSSPTIASFKTFTQMSGPSAYIQTTVHTPAIRTNLTNMTTLQTSLDFTKASGMSSTDTGGNTEHTVTSEHNSVGQFDNTSIMPDEYLVSAISDSRLACIIKCTSSCADYANSTEDTSPNIPYKVNRNYYHLTVESIPAPMTQECHHCILDP